MKKFTLLLVFALTANVFLTNDLFGQITYVGASSPTAVATSGSITVNKPAGIQVGDVMIAIINENDNSGGEDLGNANTLSGWTLIDDAKLTGDNPEAWGYIYYRIANSTDASVGTTSYTFDLSNNADGAVGSIIAYRGVDVTGGVTASGAAGGPFDVDPGNIGNINNDATINASALSTVNADAAVIMIGLSGGTPTFSSWSTTTPGALNEVLDGSTTNGADCAIGAAWAIKTSTGTTGAGSASLSASFGNGGLLVALKRLPPPSVTLSPSTTQSIFTGSSVSFTATALNYPGSGDYTYTWSVSPAATIPGSNPNTIAASSDVKSITFNNAGTYTVSVQISRGATTLTTSSTTVQVFAPNLWSVSGTGALRKYTVDPVNGNILFGPANVVTPSVSTAAVGKNAPNPNDPNGCIYYLNRDNGGTLNGVVTIYAVNPDGTGNTSVGNIDMNGASDGDFSFVRLGFDATGRGWILAGTDANNNIFIASFQGNGTSAISSVNTYGSNPLTVAAPGTASEFQNGDLAITANGTLYALANVTDGQTYIYTLNSLSTPTTLTRKWIVQDNGGTFSGSVNGLAWTQSGSLHFSTSTGIYFIDQTTANTVSGTVQASLVPNSGGLSLTDLASDKFPSQSTLPVTMGLFSVAKQGDFAVLNWKTTTEINTDHFEIERSYDGVSFTKVAAKAAAGNSNSDINYQHSDPINYNYQIVYYRLKTVDIDAKSSYSKIVALRLSNGPIKNLTVFPNPFTTDLKLQISSLSETTGTVRISNAIGQVVYNRNIILQKGENIVVLTSGLETLKPGMHLMEVITTEGKVTQKIIKR